MPVTITYDGDEAVAVLADAQRDRGRWHALTRHGDAYRVAPVPRAIDARDRFYYSAYYRLVLPSIGAVARVLPTRFVRALASRADRREAAAEYGHGASDRAASLAAEAKRVGVLRRLAIDRYDARADATVTYYAELRRRSEGS